MLRFKQILKTDSSGYIFALTDEGQLVRLMFKSNADSQKPLTYQVQGVQVESLKGDVLQAAGAAIQ